MNDRMSSTDINPRWLTKPALILIAIASAIVAYLAFRSMGIQPVVMSDEQRFNTYSRILDPSQAVVPSYLFYFLYRLTNKCGAGFLECGRLLNIMLLCLSSIPFYLICKEYLSRKTALYVTLSAMLAPWAYYTTYYMPELLYYLIFCISAWIIISENRYRNVWIHSCLSGASLGLLSLVKPHAFFLIPAYIAFRIYYAFNHHRYSWLRLVGLVIFAIATMFIVRLALGYLIAGSASLNLVGSMYGTVVDKGTAPNHMQTLFQVLYVARGHIYGLLVLFALPFVASIIAMTQNGDGEVGQVKNIAFLAIAVLACMLGVTALYTMQANGIGVYETLTRLHMRYYFFLFPIFTSIGALFCNRQDIQLKFWHKVVVVCVIVATLYAGFKGLNSYTPYPVDAPDLWTIVSKPIALRGFTLLQACALVLLLIGPSTASKFFTYILTPVLIILAAAVFPAFLGFYRAPNAADQAGIFYDMTIGTRDPVAVVDDDDSQATRVIFHLNSKNIQKILVPATTLLTPQQISPEIRWVIAMNNNPLDASLQSELAYDMPGYKIWHVGTSDYDVDFSASAWPGVKSISGVYSAESFGRWSDGKQVTIVFKKDIPTDVALNITAAAFALNAGKDFEIQIGDRVQKLKLGQNPTSTSLNYRNISPHTHEVTITVPEPISPKDAGISPDPRKLGIALVRITLTPSISQ